MAMLANTLLLITLLLLKVFNLVKWSWWIILTPAWVPIAAVLFFGLAYLIIALIDKIGDK